MSPKEFQEAALKTAPTNLDPIRARFNGMGITDLVHAQMGIVTEAGEFTDALKKFLIYGKCLDITNAKEELGDLMWYIALACKALETDIEDEMISVIVKLKIRYPEKFTEKDALERKDKIDMLSDKYRCPSCGSLDHTVCSEGI